MNIEKTAPTKWVIIFVEFNLNKLLNINIYTLFSVQQRYVLAVMMFFGLGVTFALRLSFSLVLTQMVYIPNANNKTADSNDELVCPIKYEYTSQNETAISSVRKKFTVLRKN